MSVVLIPIGVYLVFARDTFYFVFDPAFFLPFHSGVEIFTIFVAAAIAYVSFVGYMRDGGRTILLLGTAFLSQAALDAIHNLAYPGMPFLFIRTGTNEAIYLWLFARISGSLLLLMSSILPEKEARQEMRSKALILASVAVALLSIASAYTVNSFVEVLPAMFIPGKGLTMLKIGLEYLVSLALGITALLYLRMYLDSVNKTILMFTIGVVLLAFSEIGFTLYRHAYDVYNSLGHVFKLVAFIAFLAGLLKAR